MSQPTEEQHDWIKDLLRVDPRSFAEAGSSRGQAEAGRKPDLLRHPTPDATPTHIVAASDKEASTQAKVPTKAEIAALMKEKGGSQKLDALITALPDNASPDIMKSAIQTRFGIKSFENLASPSDDKKTKESASTKSLKRIYQLLEKIPAADVQNNPSLLDIQVYGGAADEKANDNRGSYYDPKKKQIVLSCGRADAGFQSGLVTREADLGKVDDDCQMVPDSTDSPTPDYFDWTTLHEVGHAIDDKKKFMDGKIGNSAFGGWHVYGNDVKPVAAAIAKATHLAGPEALVYLTAYLGGSSAGRPAAPHGAKNWEAGLVTAENWCDAIRVDAKLWENKGAIDKHVADGRVFQEAYENSWVSYEIGARSKGITGYQFRAPGEWLAELYAAYYSKKLKPSHPAVKWLATL